jgi:hypothetical protein
MAVSGIPITLGDGKEYVIAPLTLGALEDHGDAINQMGDLTAGSVKTAIDIAHSSLRRNYPDMTREQVRDLIDIANMDRVIEACMDVSGLKRKELEEAQAAAGAGEAQREAPAAIA